MFMVVVNFKSNTVVQWGDDTVKLFRIILQAYDKTDFVSAFLARQSDGYKLVDIVK